MKSRKNEILYSCGEIVSEGKKVGFQEVIVEKDFNKLRNPYTHPIIFKWDKTCIFWEFAKSYANNLIVVIHNENNKTVDFISKLKETLKFSLHNPYNFNISNPDKYYNGCWFSSSQPWLDIVQKGQSGKTVFTEKIIEEAKKYKKAVEDFAKNSGIEL